MTMQRVLRIASLVAAATTPASCGTPVPYKAPAPDAGVDTPPPPPPPPPTPTARSCKELLAATPTLASGAYQLASQSGAPYPAYCDMAAAGGGWTLVLKADGGSASSQFGYDSPLWTNTATLDDQQPDTSRAEAKYRAFSEVAFSQIGILMQAASTGTLTLDVGGTPLASVMSGSFIPVAKTRTDWLTLMPGAVMQPDCNQGGVNNYVADPYVRVRIGMLGNFGMNCSAPDSFIGVGGGGGGVDPCYTGTAASPFVPPSVGVLGGGTCTSTPSTIPANLPGFAYVYVR
jgi:hypothetical protein